MCASFVRVCGGTCCTMVVNSRQSCTMLFFSNEYSVTLAKGDLKQTRGRKTCGNVKNFCRLDIHINIPYIVWVFFNQKRLFEVQRFVFSKVKYPPKSHLNDLSNSYPAILLNRKFLLLSWGCDFLSCWCFYLILFIYLQTVQQAVIGQWERGQ